VVEVGEGAESMMVLLPPNPTQPLISSRRTRQIQGLFIQYRMIVKVVQLVSVFQVPNRLKGPREKIGKTLHRMPSIEGMSLGELPSAHDRLIEHRLFPKRTSDRT
jgi:hypothetical protein